MREAVDKRQNRVAVKQQSLTFAGMGHIGQLMGADVQLLGQNLPVTVGLIEHIHKVRIFKNVRYFGTCQKVLHILRILGTCRTDADDLPMQPLHKGCIIGWVSGVTTAFPPKNRT